ncbi:MAG: FAD-binding oxidoreductase [Chloroflexi bacterium]|nr:FAD-binding oxidoreductase [Chloroflexota bacterium]
MTTNVSDVVIVGGGIVGIATAYFLAKAGVKSTVIERDAVGSHASGFAYGGLSPTGDSDTSGQLLPDAQVSSEGMRLHREFATSLQEETGINTEFRERPTLSLAFTEEEAQAAKSHVSALGHVEGWTARWLDSADARAIEPRISDEAVGAIYTEGGADVEPYRFVLALLGAAENMGATIRHGEVTGLKREGSRVTGVVLNNGEVSSDCVVLAAGPWTGEASSWLNVPIKVGPLKGQILRLRAPGAPFRVSIGWNGNYATTKPDGLLWTGTTEEEAGFDERPTPEARDQIMASLLKMIPSLEDAQLVQQTACLRPLADDGKLVLGAVPDWDGVYIATGTGRKGILLGPAVGRLMADLITKGATDIPLEQFSPSRFAR